MDYPEDRHKANPPRGGRGQELHDEARGRTLVDFNRAGVPLAEIVTEPDMTSPEEPKRFLRNCTRSGSLDISDGSMGRAPSGAMPTFR
jgi:Asp-tRNA(Asn)/Glu-tRNA(Gln) amidotransferase B subunit